ncbi:MAG: phosphopantetheine-binding protein [Halieaceae bacterium]|nr:phosphopantetheine-binding protein [Halieaceae bacterium]
MASYEQYLQFMYTLLEKSHQPEIELSEITELVADIGMSSLEVMEFIEQIEDEFDISIPLNLLPGISTIGQLAACLPGLQD